jgi:hypothetical protein
MNEALWLSFAFIDLLAVVLLFRFFGRVGLFAFISFSLVLCNIQVMKTVELFGLTTTLGNILYAGTFLATDMIGEFYGKKEAKRAVLLGFATLALATLYMQIALYFTPAEGDFAQEHLSNLFGFLPRIALGSTAAYLVSQWHDVWAFHYLKEKTKGRMLWLRNLLSTSVSQLLDSVVFVLIAFYGVFDGPVLVEILITTYLMKLIVACLDTPFIYLAKRLGAPQSACSQPSYS